MRILFIGVVIFSVACVSSVRGGEYYELATALTKLTRALDTANRYETVDAGLGDAEFISASTQHDPGLVEPFEKFDLRIFRLGKELFVMVCRSENDAILADAGCTAKLDQHLWQRERLAACMPDEKLIQACSGE